MSKASNLAGFVTSILPVNNLSVGVITASSFVGNGAGLTGVGIGSTGSINTSGIITASSFVGNGAGLTGVGIGSTGNVNTTGIITASKVSANEFIGTGDKLIFSPTITSFSPADGATGVSALSSPNIVLTYDQNVSFGIGTITLRKNSASGDIVESYQVGVSTRATISNQTLTIDPTNNFDYAQEYYLVIPQGALKNALNSNSVLLDTYNFTTEANPILSSINPPDEATSVGISTNIVFTFNKTIRAGVGTITLRTVSATGSIVESYDVTSSARLTFSGSTLTIDPTNNLSTTSTVYYVVVPDGAIGGYAGVSTYNFTSRALQLGDVYEGGYLICQSGGTRWIAALSGSGGTWATRGDAITAAQNASGGCGGWFIPSTGQLQNPGYTCRTYWPFVGGNYWSSTEFNADRGYVVQFYNGGNIDTQNKTFTNFAHAFRTVNY